MLIAICKKGATGRIILQKIRVVTLESFFDKDPQEFLEGFPQKYCYTLKVGDTGLNLLTKSRLKSNEFDKYKNTKMYEYLITI